MIFLDEMFWKIIRWLSPADPEVNHAAARELQQSGTGKWFTEGEAFRNWFSPDYSFLWLHGKRIYLAFPTLSQSIGLIPNYINLMIT